MRKIKLICRVLLIFFIQPIYAQISFIEFEQPQCGLISDHGYTFENLSMMCGSHSSGYKIYLDGNKVFEKCIEFGGCSIIELMFIDKSTGFLVEGNNNGYSVYKTDNSGASWISIGGGAPTFLGFYLVNINTGYLITTWDNPLNLYITRVSDISSRFISDSEINNDTIINDTIFGINLCDIDSLSFKIKNSSDTIKYQISFIKTPISIDNFEHYTNFNVFPNPTYDFISISKDIQINEDSQVNILDIKGRIVKRFLNIHEKYYIGDLKKGLYFIEIINYDTRFIGKVLKY